MPLIDDEAVLISNYRWWWQWLSSIITSLLRMRSASSPSPSSGCCGATGNRGNQSWLILNISKHQVLKCVWKLMQVLIMYVDFGVCPFNYIICWLFRFYKYCARSVQALYGINSLVHAYVHHFTWMIYIFRSNTLTRSHLDSVLWSF